MLREQMEKIINDADLIQSFYHDTSESFETPLGPYDPPSSTNEARRSAGIMYGIDCEDGGEYKLGIFMKDRELRAVLFNSEYDTLQTAAMVYYTNVSGSHTAVSLREVTFETFGKAVDPMRVASDDERGNAVMKLMMLNERARDDR